MTQAEWAVARGDWLRANYGSTMADICRPEGLANPREFPSALAWNSTKIAFLHPQFRVRFSDFILAVESVAEARGIEFIIWDGFRSLRRQLELYAQGRTKPGRIVTRTITSRHLFGCAIDLCVLGPRGNPLFSLPSWYRTDILPLAKGCGLESLYLARGLDEPHIQVPHRDLPTDVIETEQTLRDEFARLKG